MPKIDYKKKAEQLAKDNIESVGWIDVNLKLPSEGELVDVKYTVGSANPKQLIEKGKVNKRGRFSGEMDWKYATHWKPTVL